MAHSQPAAARRPTLGAMRYAAGQGLRVCWYGAHYAVLRRMTARGAAHEETPKTPAEPVDRARLRTALLDVFRQDHKNVAQGLYPRPRDLDPKKLGSAVAASRAFFADVSEVDHRRRRRDGVEVRKRADASRYPTYYQQNFHYQTDGWLSRESAHIYDTQVEVLFTGAADAMRRAGLAEISREICGKDQRRRRVLDVACGTGRFLEQVLDAFPRLNVTGVDLSQAYLEEAGDRLARWPGTSLVHANAECVPLEDGAFDVVSSTYLFHELPPRVRRVIAAEMARLTRPGGLVIVADSLQTGDEPALDGLLERFPDMFHEPYYESYCAEDLDALFAPFALTRERQTLAFLTKVMTWRKPAAG